MSCCLKNVVLLKMHACCLKYMHAVYHSCIVYIHPCKRCVRSCVVCINARCVLFLPRLHIRMRCHCPCLVCIQARGAIILVLFALLRSMFCSCILYICACGVFKVSLCCGFSVTNANCVQTVPVPTAHVRVVKVLCVNRLRRSELD